MSLSIIFQEGKELFGPYQLASASGWKLVGEYANVIASLQLRQLVDTGEVEDTEMLALSINTGLKVHPPDNEDVKHTLTQLLSRIGVGSSDETAKIIGG